MIEAPRCPKCGAPMRERVARTGSNAGNKFYGCSNFPRCRGTRPYPYQPDMEEESTLADILDDEQIFSTFPRKLVARPRFKDYSVRFYESIALPEEILDLIYYENYNGLLLYAISQWRLDFPRVRQRSNLQENEMQIIAVLEKILNRGKLTIASPFVEQKLKGLFEKSHELTVRLSIDNGPENLDEVFARLITEFLPCQKADFDLDSKEESVFYKQLLPKYSGGLYSHFTIPQISLDSLLPPDGKKRDNHFQRVDFAVFNPFTKKNYVIEIDGSQHERNRTIDQQRDWRLKNADYQVIRIQARDVRNNTINHLNELFTVNGNYQRHTPSNSIISICKLIAALKIVHQIQLAVINALQTGFLKLDSEIWHIITDIESAELFDAEELELIYSSISEDLLQLIRHLFNIYHYKGKVQQIRVSSQNKHLDTVHQDTLYLSFTGDIHSDRAHYIQNIYFPFSLSDQFPFSAQISKGLKKPNKRDLEFFLQYIFRKDQFREGQYEGICRALQGKDTLLLLPTGAGKSLVFQLASLLLPGRAIIIDPIISLMQDQIENLKASGIDRCEAITSMIRNPSERKKAIETFEKGEYLFLYISPERFQIEEFRQAVKNLTQYIPISLIAIDEAHCVSEWGHDFRTAYLNIGRITREYCASGHRIPPLIGLTGTASRAVLKDVQRELQILDPSAIITPRSFDRKELKFHVLKSSSETKFQKLEKWLTEQLPALLNGKSNHNDPSFHYRPNGKETKAGLIFCPHVNGSFGVLTVKEKLEKLFQFPVGIYSGAAPRDFDKNQNYDRYKSQVAYEFKHNKIPLLVCTKSFGMGIDKPNIRFTVHYSLPPSIESFYQEAGRAGRDKKTAHCCIIVSIDEPSRAKNLLNPDLPVEDVDKSIQKINYGENDDVTRALYFHTRAFKGQQAELKIIRQVLKMLKDLTKKRSEKLLLQDLENKFSLAGNSFGLSENNQVTRNDMEKALHRLLIIHVIDDYTVDYLNEAFNVSITGAAKETIIDHYCNYVSNYSLSRMEKEKEEVNRYLPLPHEQFVLKVIERLLDFIYEVIENGRRRALDEMLQAVSGNADDKHIRQRILNYLQSSPFAADIEMILNDPKGGLSFCRDIYQKIAGPLEASELRGQVARYLESYPDHPALLMMRALTELLSEDHDFEVVTQNMLAAISNAKAKYNIETESLYGFAAWGIGILNGINHELAEHLTLKISAETDRVAARTLLKNLPDDLLYIPANYLLKKVIKKLPDLIN